MKITTEIDANNNIRKHKVTGGLSKSLLLEKLKEIYSGLDFQSNMDAYWDFSFADLTLFSLEDTEELASFVKIHWIPTKLQKVALMAPDPLTYLISKKIAQQFTNHASTSIEVFDQQEDAFKWLKH